VSDANKKRAQRVLVVEDDETMRTMVGDVCRRERYDLVEAASGEQGLQLATADEPDLVLLDWVLPDMSGIDVCRELRRRGAVCPILMLTGRTSKVDVVVGLQVGADDYITKPVDLHELAARLAAHLRRARMSPTGSREGVLRVGDVQIDTDAHRVRVGEQEIRLTLTEFNLLALLAANQGRVLTRSQLLEKVWGYLAEVGDHSVDPHVQRLRRKLDTYGESGIVVEAVAGLGYRLTRRKQG
jgi:two-component system response regulator RegX3